MDTMDLLWNVDMPNQQVSVRIRIGTTIQLVRLEVPALTEADPPGAWISAACRLLADAIERLPERDVHALPETVRPPLGSE